MMYGDPISAANTRSILSRTDTVAPGLATWT